MKKSGIQYNPCYNNYLCWIFIADCGYNIAAFPCFFVNLQLCQVEVQVCGYVNQVVRAI